MKQELGSRVLQHIQTGLDRTDTRLVTVPSFAPRKDANGSLSEAYRGMSRESFFRPPSRISLANGDEVVFLSLIAASPHTEVTLKGIETDENEITFGEKPDAIEFPAHQFHWLYKQRGNGLAVPISYADLAAYPDHEREEILSAYAERLIEGKKTVDAAVIDQNILGAENGSLIYATVGHHPLSQRKKDGLGRGSQSNPTIHTSVVFLPPTESIEKVKSFAEMTPAELLKDIDPLSSIFFEVTNQPIKSLMEQVVDDYNVTASVEVISEDTDHTEPFPYGWKVNFNEDTGLDKGMDMFVHFMSQMKLLWKDGKALRADTDDVDLQTKVAQFVGKEGVSVLSRLMKVKGERTNDEEKTLKTRLEEAKEHMLDTDVSGHVYVYLMEDLLSDYSKFTMPGDPSFNLLYDVDTQTGNLKSLSFTPAMSEKGLAERLTGAVYEREER